MNKESLRKKSYYPVENYYDMLTVSEDNRNTLIEQCKIYDFTNGIIKATLRMISYIYSGKNGLSLVNNSRLRKIQENVDIKIKFGKIRINNSNISLYNKSIN